jgi:hypothetical protein
METSSGTLDEHFEVQSASQCDLVDPDASKFNDGTHDCQFWESADRCFLSDASTDTPRGSIEDLSNQESVDFILMDEGGDSFKFYSAAGYGVMNHEDVSYCPRGDADYMFQGVSTKLTPMDLECSFPHEPWNASSISCEAGNSRDMFETEVNRYFAKGQDMYQSWSQSCSTTAIDNTCLSPLTSHDSKFCSTFAPQWQWAVPIDSAVMFSG